MLLKKLFNPYTGLRKEIYIILISTTINAFGALIFPFMTLLLNNKIGLSPSQTGYIVALTGILYAPASLIGGKISDKWGRKKVLIVFEILAALSYTVCIFLDPGMKMVIMLMSASFFFGVAGPSHGAMITDLTTPEQRQGAYSLSYLGFNLGFAFAQILAGHLFQNHLQIMFIIDAATAMTGILLIAFFVPETYKPNINSIEKLKQKSTGESILKVLLKKPLLIYFSLAAFGYRFVYSQWSFMIPMQLEHNFYGEGARLFGFLGSVNAFFVVIFTPILTALFAKKSNLDRIIYGGILFSMGFGLLGVFNTKEAFFISVIVFTTGEILEAISIMPFIMNHTPETHRGKMNSILPLLMGAGFSIGPIVMGTVLEKSSFSVSWAVAAIVVLTATIGMRFIRTYDLKNTKQLEMGGIEPPS
ncbi:MAG: MFS transporter [Spirochaetales bacterium]|nr:MFS transporter [Spirochaetales bacterium]